MPIAEERTLIPAFGDLAAKKFCGTPQLRSRVPARIPNDANCDVDSRLCSQASRATFIEMSSARVCRHAAIIKHDSKCLRLR
jgi:hypothetical protein